MTSLRGQLIAWLVIPSLVALGLAAALSYVTARGQINHLFDTQMQAFAARLIAEPWGAVSLHEVTEMEEEDDAEEAEEAAHEAEEDEAWEDYGFVFQAWNPQGEALLGTPLVRADRDGFFNAHLMNRDYRVYQATRGGVSVQVAQQQANRRLVSARLALYNLLPWTALIPLQIGVIWFGICRGLHPLGRLTRSVSARAPGDLALFDAGPLPHELKPLVQALNGLIDRLDRALEAQRRFVADAAHALRTPLAALALQVSLLEDERDEAARTQAQERLQAGIHRATHLVQQLLHLARLEPEAPTARITLDLTDLTKQAITEHALLAEAHDIDLGLTEASPAPITGEPESLRMLLDNLLDNAIKYTPPGGRVDVAVRRHADGVELTVSDTGPGIPPAERPRVFERFYRGLDSEAQGSGLGLAIVKRVAEWHDAKVTLSEGETGRGLYVHVWLPNNPLSRR